jgi:tellurite resistance protein TerC
MQEPLWVWITFNLVMLSLILADLFLLHRGVKVITIKKALLTSAFWISLALLFNYGIYIYKGQEAALNFLAGYLIEEALSVDNLFVFITIFAYFRTPPEYHHKVLFWGILGAIIMRAFFIFFGIALVNHFHWMLYIFGVFLIYAGIKMARSKNEEIHPDNNPILKLAKRFLSVTPNYEGNNFFVHRLGKWWATPLFIVLLAVESTDLIFAIDSIPAVMAITRDPFIIYTSNIFAILGLRSLYFALAGLMSLFHYLNYGLAAILTFVGLKMLTSPFFHIPIGISLAFIAVSLGSAICFSLLNPKVGLK